MRFCFVGVAEVVWNSSPATMHSTEKRPTGIKSGITCSVKATNDGRHGVSPLGGGMRNVFSVNFLFLFVLSRFDCARMSI